MISIAHAVEKGCLLVVTLFLGVALIHGVVTRPMGPTVGCEVWPSGSSSASSTMVAAAFIPRTFFLLNLSVLVFNIHGLYVGLYLQKLLSHMLLRSSCFHDGGENLIHHCRVLQLLYVWYVFVAFVVGSL